MEHHYNSNSYMYHVTNEEAAQVGQGLRYYKTDPATVSKAWKTSVRQWRTLKAHRSPFSLLNGFLGVFLSCTCA